MIRFVIRQMDFQRLHLAIDRVDQPRLLRQAMHRADPAARQPAHAIAVLVLDVARAVHRRRLRCPRPRPQPPLDSSFAPCHILMSTGLHSKCPPISELVVCRPINSAMGYGHFEHFAYTPSRKRACTGSRTAKTGSKVV